MSGSRMQLSPKAYSILGVAVFALLTDDEEDEEDAVDEDDQNKEGVEDNTIFIPLGFAYKLPRSYYKGTDPEWQSFVELSKNKKLCEYLKNQLTGMVGQYVGSMPPFQKVLGEKHKPRKFWIDIDFPQGPPPEYERKGLEWGDDYIRWSTRPVHPLHYSKLQKALWPASLASSVWASQKTLVSLQYDRIKNILAYPAGSEAPSSEEDSPPSMQLQKLSEQTKPSKQESASESNGDFPPEAPTFRKALGEPPSKTGLSDRSRFLPVTPTIPTLGTDTVSAVDAFKETFARTWRPAHAPPERGTVIFSGLVELVGSDGFVVLDVRAAYHPAESRWTQISLVPRRMQPRKQGPRGGP
ncbi:MAG: hypothetical protein Q9208_007611 [Pyrenodesmia sp. 3 TL-2023]